ncbi:MAG TPA: amidohydrolase family protein [Solirubrobacteraceae bacterium]
MDARRPSAQAVLIRAGRIAMVGDRAEIDAAAGDAPRLECEGRTLVPGFVDGHTHVELSCLSREHWVQAQTPPCRSLDDIGRRIRDREDSGDGWLVCRCSFALQDKVVEQRLFTREELDDLVPDRPLAVLAGLHVAMLNTAALRRLDLWDREPPGVTLQRAADGTPTGVATEVWDLIPGLPRDAVMEAIAAHHRDLTLAQGITSAHTIPFSAADAEACRLLQARGGLPLRLRTYCHVPRSATLEALIESRARPGAGDDWLRFGGVKIFVDGQHGDGLGRVFDDFKWTPGELARFVAQAHGAGLQLWMHAVSPGAVRMAARAVASATAGTPGRGRHRIEHGGDYLDVADIPLLRATGVRLVTTPHFLRSDTPVPGQSPLRTLIDAGFEPIGGTDTTGTVPEGAGPLFNIACAVNRTDAEGRVLDPDERIGVGEALRLFTAWAAAGAFEEDVKGRLAPGMLGDAVLVSEDVLSLPPERLFDVRVDATVVDGRVVYRR